MNNSLLGYDIDYTLIYDIEIDTLKKYNIIPLIKEDLFLIIATSNKDQNDQKFVDLFHYPIKFLEVEQSEIEFELENLELKLGLFKLATKSLSSSTIDSNNSYILDFIDSILSYSIEHNVSDIHSECLDGSVIIRVRIDGELIQIFRYEISLHLAISSIIKYLGNLDISQKRLPLNARFSREVQNNSYDIRISTMPTIYGESIVLRILDNGNVQKSLENIGLEKETLTLIQKTLRLTQGLVLVTGPTGSGKTTTLYSMLNALNTKQKKIITIEDPVEYKLNGVMQVNVNNEIELNYHTVLKNILRQDPDILMIGEIRDAESLQTAMQAALTGHLVIATLHTNSAVETITRLLDLKAESYLIASTLKMVLSQRLLRMLCPNCKKKTTDNRYEPCGCVECNFTGYKSRKIVSEILEINETISEQIANNENIATILKASNFTTIQENGKELVNQGITTLSEFYSKL